ncbi:hypothetical protein JCM16814_17880 [Desulfobaculum senezii]
MQTERGEALIRQLMEQGVVSCPEDIEGRVLRLRVCAQNTDGHNVETDFSVCGRDGIEQLLTNLRRCGCRVLSVRRLDAAARLPRGCSQMPRPEL